MFVHIAMFKWKPGTTEADVAEIAAALGTLPGLVPSLRSYSFGPDLGLSPAGVRWDFAIIAHFDDEAGWRAYQDHPDHDKVRADVVAPRIGERAGVQFTTN